MTAALSSLGAPVPAPSYAPTPEARADKAAKEFEAVFISQMIEPLLSSVKTPDIAGGGQSEDYFKALMRDSYAKAIAERGGFGIAREIKAKLLELQAASDGVGILKEAN